MSLYAFSDVHLGSGPPDKEHLKVAKIQKLVDLIKDDGDRLVILGDLFDFWFEYKHAMPKDQFQVLNMLFQLKEKGVQIDYISGNHDFWMDDFFEKQLGITVHRDNFELVYDDQKILFVHGDGLSPADWKYRILKRILRNKLNIWLYRKLPPDWAIPLAKFVSGSSREYTARREHHFAVDYENYAEKKLNNGYNIVAIGHLHLPVSKVFENGTYINTGDFINHFSYMKIKNKNISLNYIG
jgi:UDP-2,3-diacylglucosamine hydrolase